MIFSVSNQSGEDVYLLVEHEAHYIKKGEKDVRIEGCEKKQVITVKRVNTIPLPQYKSVLASELWGLLALLFVKPWRYTIDVSSSYVFYGEKNTVFSLKIEKSTNQQTAIVMYDAIVMTSPCLGTANISYTAENKAAILKMRKRSRRTAHFWLYFVLVFLFSLIFLGETFVFSLILSTFPILDGMFGRTLLYLLSSLLLLLILTLFIVPLHIWFKHEDKKFCELMEENKICLNLEKRGDPSLAPKS